jgi:hypothetical protein
MRIKPYFLTLQFHLDNNFELEHAQIRLVSPLVEGGPSKYARSIFEERIRKGNDMMGGLLSQIQHSTLIVVFIPT